MSLLHLVNRVENIIEFKIVGRCTGGNIFDISFIFFFFIETYRSFFPTSELNKILGSYEELYSVGQNKMVSARLAFEVCPLATIPERTDVGDGPTGERGTSETPPKPLRQREGHQAAINGLEGYYR